MPITGLLDQSGFMLTAELGAAEGFINASFYRHLAAQERQRVIFIGGISSPEETTVVGYS